MFHIPRHCGSFSLVALFGIILLHGVVAGGHGAQTLQMTSASFGFAVEHISINGVRRLSEIDVLAALSLDEDSSLLDFDVLAAREALMQMPWVETAHVRKIYPDQLQINLVEYEPVALWQHQGELSIIDRQGRIIAPHDARAPSLPLVVGRGGEREAAHLLQVMEQFPQLKERIRAYIRVADRRWDLLLDNGLDIKLPEHDFAARLTSLLDDPEYADLLSRDILGVDLRFEDRIVLALSDAAVGRHALQLKEQLRQARTRKVGRP